MKDTSCCGATAAGQGLFTVFGHADCPGRPTVLAFLYRLDSNRVRCGGLQASDPCPRVLHRFLVELRPARRVFRFPRDQVTCSKCTIPGDTVHYPAANKTRCSWVRVYEKTSLQAFKTRENNKK